jgi:hypothetical protein
MPCACNGGGTQTTANQEKEFEVKLPNGRIEYVRGEHAAKVAATMGGPGTTYSATGR